MSCQIRSCNCNYIKPSLYYIFIYNMAPLNRLGSKNVGPSHVSDPPTLGYTMMKNYVEMDRHPGAPQFMICNLFTRKKN